MSALGMFHPHDFFMPHPPLCILWQKACGPLGHEKHPEFGLSYRLRKSRGAELGILLRLFTA